MVCQGDELGLMVSVASGYYRYMITIFVGSGGNRPLLGSHKADQYYYELLGRSYTVVD
jgi:hypothetical protein